MTVRARRPMVAVVGDSNLEPTDERVRMAREVGCFLVDHGCRVITGGLGGVMAAAMEGARQSTKYHEGDTVGVLPGHDPSEAAEAADIVLATGMSLGRNVVVANADGLIAIGGGAGTLSEIALAWQLRRPIVALDADGWSRKLCACRIDERTRQADLADDQVHAATTPADAVRRMLGLLPKYTKRMRYV